MEDESNRSLSLFEDSIDEEVFFGPVTSAERRARKKFQIADNNCNTHLSPHFINSDFVIANITTGNDNDLKNDNDSLNHSGNKSSSKTSSDEYFSPPSSVKGFLSFQDSLENSEEDAEQPDVEVKLKNNEMEELSQEDNEEVNLKDSTNDVLYDSLEDICSLVSNLDKCSISEKPTFNEHSENVESIFLNSIDDIKNVNTRRGTKSIAGSHSCFDEDSLSAIDIKLYDDSLDESNLSPYLKGLSDAAKHSSCDILDNNELEFFTGDSSVISIENVKFKDCKAYMEKRNLFQSVDVVSNKRTLSSPKSKFVNRNDDMQANSSSLSENPAFCDSLDEDRPLADASQKLFTKSCLQKKFFNVERNSFHEDCDSLNLEISSHCYLPFDEENSIHSDYASMNNDSLYCCDNEEKDDEVEISVLSGSNILDNNCAHKTETTMMSLKSPKVQVDLQKPLSDNVAKASDENINYALGNSAISNNDTDERFADIKSKLTDNSSLLDYKSCKSDSLSSHKPLTEDSLLDYKSCKSDSLSSHKPLTEDSSLDFEFCKGDSVSSHKPILGPFEDNLIQFTPNLKQNNSYFSSSSCQEAFDSFAIFGMEVSQQNPVSVSCGKTSIATDSRNTKSEFSTCVDSLKESSVLKSLDKSDNSFMIFSPVTNSLIKNSKKSINFISFSPDTPQCVKKDASNKVKFSADVKNCNVLQQNAPCKKKSEMTALNPEAESSVYDDPFSPKILRQQHNILKSKSSIEESTEVEESGASDCWLESRRISSSDKLNICNSPKSLKADNCNSISKILHKDIMQKTYYSPTSSPLKMYKSKEDNESNISQNIISEENIFNSPRNSLAKVSKTDSNFESRNVMCKDMISKSVFTSPKNSSMNMSCHNAETKNILSDELISKEAFHNSPKNSPSKVHVTDNYFVSNKNQCENVISKHIDNISPKNLPLKMFHGADSKIPATNLISHQIADNSPKNSPAKNGNKLNSDSRFNKIPIEDIILDNITKDSSKYSSMKINSCNNAESKIFRSNDIISKQTVHNSPENLVVTVDKLDPYSHTNKISHEDMSSKQNLHNMPKNSPVKFRNSKPVDTESNVNLHQDKISKQNVCNSPKNSLVRVNKYENTDLISKHNLCNSPKKTFVKVKQAEVGESNIIPYKGTVLKQNVHNSPKSSPIKIAKNFEDMLCLPLKSTLQWKNKLQKFHPFSESKKEYFFQETFDFGKGKFNSDKSLLQALDLQDLSVSFVKDDSILESKDSLMSLNLCTNKIGSEKIAIVTSQRCESKENIPTAKKNLLLPLCKSKKLNVTPVKSPSERKQLPKTTISSHKKIFAKPTATKIPIPQANSNVSKFSDTTPKFVKPEQPSIARKLKSPMIMKPSFNSPSVQKPKEVTPVTTVKTPTPKKTCSSADSSSKSKLPKSAQVITPKKFWNVSSPVSKYINETPIAPLFKVIHPKEGVIRIPRPVGEKKDPPNQEKESIDYRPTIPVAIYKPSAHRIIIDNDEGDKRSPTKSGRKAKKDEDEGPVLYRFIQGPSAIIPNCDYLANDDSFWDTSRLQPDGTKIFSQHSVQCTSSAPVSEIPTVYEKVKVKYAKPAYRNKKME